MEVKAILTTKSKIRTVVLFLAGMLIVGGYALRQRSLAAYNPVTATSNQHYDAQIVNQTNLKSGYNLYASGPYNTSAGNVRAVANGSKYNNDYVRVMQTKTTKTGSYARLRYFNQYLGWMNVHGIKQVSFAQIAQGTMRQYDVIGTAALEPYTNQPPVIVSNGYADKARGVVNSGAGSVVYPLASLQKAMTAVMIQQLINEGKLSASTLLSKYYPQVPYSSSITIAQMLAMTSGLDNTDATPAKQMTENQAFTNMVKSLQSTNDHAFSYSDANYVLLAGVIAKVTGQSYAENLEDRILNPVGMTNTFMVTSAKPTFKATLAVGYKKNGGRKDYTSPERMSYPRMSAIPGAGNLLSTPSDYYKFILSIRNGTLLNEDQHSDLLGYGSTYSGGVYVTRPGIYFNNGSFGGTGYHTGFFATNNNEHIAVVFTNQTPLGGGISGKNFVAKMYNVATYY